jgi:hypothetical protein
MDTRLEPRERHPALELVLVGLLLDERRLGRVGRQQLGEIERDLRRPTTLVEPHPLVHARAKLCVLGDQRRERALVQPQQAAVLERLDAGCARHAEIQRQLAEEVAAAQVADVLALLARPLVGAQATLLDDEQGPRRVALANGELAGFELHGRERLEHRHDCCRRQSREGGVHAQEVAQPARSRLQGERLADAGVQTRQRLEDRSVEPQRLHISGGAYRRGARRTIEQAAFTERVPGSQHVQ